MHRQGDALPAAHADPGRGHFFHRHPHGDADPERFRQDDGGQDQLHRGPQALHHPGGGHHPGDEGRQHHRAGEPREPVGEEGILCGSL